MINFNSDNSYQLIQVTEVFKWWNLSSDKSYHVKEVKKSDNTFTCCMSCNILAMFVIFEIFKIQEFSIWNVSIIWVKYLTSKSLWILPSLCSFDRLGLWWKRIPLQYDFHSGGDFPGKAALREELGSWSATRSIWKGVARCQTRVRSDRYLDIGHAGWKWQNNW